MTNTFWNGEYVFFLLLFFFFMNQKCTGTMINLRDQPTRGGTSVQRLDAKLAVEKFQLPTGRCRVPEVSPSLFFSRKGSKRFEGKFYSRRKATRNSSFTLQHFQFPSMH